MDNKGNIPLRNPLIRKTYGSQYMGQGNGGGLSGCDIQFDNFQDEKLLKPTISFNANALGGTNYTFSWGIVRQTDTYKFYFNGSQQNSLRLDSPTFTIQDPPAGNHTLTVEYYDEHDNNYLTIENIDGFKVSTGVHNLNADQSTQTNVFANLGTRSWNNIQYQGEYSFQNITNSAFAGDIEFYFWGDDGGTIVIKSFEATPNEVSDADYAGSLGGRMRQVDFPNADRLAAYSNINQHIDSGSCTNTWKCAILETE